MKKLKLLILLLVFLPTLVLADTGPKPSITVNLKNIEGTNYIIDLLSDFSDKEDLIDKIEGRYALYKDNKIYTYHEDNWYATTLRDGLLWGNITGNNEHSHKFSYFGVPSEFKVIIEIDGELKISEKISKTAFDFEVTIDVNDMKVIDKSLSQLDYLKHVGILALTIIVEVGIAYLFKTKKYEVVALTNLVTNLGLQVLMVNVSAISSSILYFALAEIAIIGIEGIVYLDNLKLPKKDIAIYTVIANIVTALLTFVI